MRGRSVGGSVGRRSVGRSDLNITLFSYTPLRYVRNVAREEKKLKSLALLVLEICLTVCQIFKGHVT